MNARPPATGIVPIDLPPAWRLVFKGVAERLQHRVEYLALQEELADLRQRIERLEAISDLQK